MGYSNELLDEHLRKTKQYDRPVMIICGPISGVRHDVFRWALEASRLEALLIGAGYMVRNPYSSVLAGEAWEMDQEAWIATSMTWIAKCKDDGRIILMPGWEMSEGVSREVAFAVSLDMPIMEYTDDDSELALFDAQIGGDA